MSHPNNNKRKTAYAIWASLVVSVILVMVFIQLINEIREQDMVSMDHKVLAWTNSIITPWLIEVMKFITMLGNISTLIVVISLTILLLLAGRRYGEAVFFAVAAVTTPILNVGLKSWLQRERPDFNRLIEVTGFSFPSGHAMGSCVIYGMIGWLLSRLVRSRPAKLAIWTLTFGVILMIGYSRIYLGVHYPSDIVAGLAAGVVWLLLCLLALKAIQAIIRHKQQPR